MKKFSPVVIVGLVLTIGCFFIYISGFGFVQAISNYAYDQFIQIIAEEPKSGEVVVVDIDEDSLEEFGQFPWSRYVMADLTRKLLDNGTSVVAFDVTFPERDRTSPIVLQEAINHYFKLDIRIQGVPDHIADFDELFRRAISNRHVILGCELIPAGGFIENPDLSNDPHYRSDHLMLKGKGRIKEFLMQATNLIVSIPMLDDEASTAFFNASPDTDSIVRSNPLVWQLGEYRYYPALALEAVRMHWGVDKCIVSYNENGVESIRLKDVTIPADQAARLTINYRRIHDAKSGFVSSFPTYSVSDVMNDRVGRAHLENKIVFIGTSATGLKDIRATPMTGFFSGVEIHATMVDNILSGDMLWNPVWMITVHAIAILVIGAFLTSFISRGKAWLSFAIASLMIAVSLVTSFLLLQKYQLVFVPSWEVLSIGIIYPVLTMIRYWEEELQKKQVRSMFGTMVSEDVLTYLEKNPGSFSLSGQKREATMMFSDVAGFTSISESLPPEKLSDLLNRYLSPMTHIIMRRRGYVDKYEGDAIMAEWGVPFAADDHAVQACLAAIEQQRELDELRPWLKRAFGHDIFVRMGLNSGTVTAGNMGSDRRFQYTVMGDAVNQAARFEPANKDYGTDIIIGETTRQLAGDSIEVRLLDKIIVTGKTIPIHIYELVTEKGRASDRTLEVISLYEEALRFHWERAWDDALDRLGKALALDAGDTPSARMRIRVALYREQPPDDNWKGEYVRASKD